MQLLFLKSQVYPIHANGLIFTRYSRPLRQRLSAVQSVARNMQMSLSGFVVRNSIWNEHFLCSVDPIMQPCYKVEHAYQSLNTKDKLPPLLFAKLIWKEKNKNNNSSSKTRKQTNKNKNKNKNKLMETYLRRVCSIYNRKKIKLCTKQLQRSS